MNLRNTGMVEAVQEVVRRKRPLLGICLGMQLLFTESEENGRHRGLELIPGRVVRFPQANKIPHMGWNQVRLEGDSPLFSGVADKSYFYFVHSYYCDPGEPVTIGTCSYGLDLPVQFKKETCWGVSSTRRSQAAWACRSSGISGTCAENKRLCSRERRMSRPGTDLYAGTLQLT